LSRVLFSLRRSPAYIISRVLLLGRAYHWGFLVEKVFGKPVQRRDVWYELPFPTVPFYSDIRKPAVSAHLYWLCLDLVS
jgi:hypothetical protein